MTVGNVKQHVARLGARDHGTWILGAYRLQDTTSKSTREVRYQNVSTPTSIFTVGPLREKNNQLFIISPRHSFLSLASTLTEAMHGEYSWPQCTTTLWDMGTVSPFKAHPRTTH